VRTACVSIGEVAEREGLSPEALRFYERLGLVFPAGRTRSGYRLYDVETLRRLRFIRMARELGFSLEEIRELLELRIAQPKAEVCRWVQQRVGKAHYNALEMSAAPPLWSRVRASM
jgi:DNA-binding transcriptional MerR regulator